MSGFAELFEQSGVEDQKLQPGQKIKARVVGIAREWIFIDLGGKSEGAVAKAEFLDPAGNCTVAVGDEVEVYFLADKNQEKLFTTRVGGSAVQAHLEEAFHGRVPVEGTVEAETKGGFLVKIGGASARAFCPYSQMGLRRVDNPESLLGQNYSFLIMEFREGGKNILLSRRQLLEQEREARKEELRNSLKVGDRVTGTVTSVRDFGAFVDIDGIEGLIPASEIGWGRVEDLHSHLEAGSQVEVVIKSLDFEADRYSFSLKETLPDPWEQTPTLFPEGSTHRGRVVRLTDFGAFVTLAPGIDGLIHISKLGAGRRINHPREVAKVGDELEVQIEAIDPANHRISLALTPPAGGEAGEEGAAKTTGRGKGAGKKPAADDDHRRDFQEYAGKKTGGSMGTLGDLLKAKLAGKS
ncbi:30S ribosomal protein S1 [Desulfurivibrio sp. D14AmB]|uniref:30S ribosomal protein S1 n=1 Tax=Desulfurivibrio sp. D14AmB TaxID=3374370 RepID=UPI00376EEB8F